MREGGREGGREGSECGQLGQEGGREEPAAANYIQCD